jgi:glutaconate CoA-transferase subunit A
MNGSAPLEEMLAGAGLIKWIETSYIGYDGVMPVPYALRKSIEEGVVELIEDYSNWSFAQRTLAGRLGLPFMPCMSDMGSDLMTYDTFGKAGLRDYHEDGAPIHPGIPPHKYAVIDDPFDGFGLRPMLYRNGPDSCVNKTNYYRSHKEFSTRYTGKPGVKVCLVPPLKPEVCVIHAQRAAEDGTVRIEGVVGPDMDQSLCGKILIVECERICPPDELRLTPECNQIPPHFVHAIVEQPFGAYPMFVPNYYDCDGQWLPMYAKAVTGKSLAEVKAFWTEHVGETKDDWDYLIRRVGWKRLQQLRADPNYHYNPNLVNA